VLVLVRLEGAEVVVSSNVRKENKKREKDLFKEHVGVSVG
jgi:hypothetical protein